MILLVVLLNIAIIAIIILSYYTYQLKTTLNGIKNIKNTTIVLGSPEVFTGDDEVKLSRDKEGLLLMIKKLETKMSLLWETLRFPSDDLALKQWRVNAIFDLRNELLSLYNRKE